MKDMPFLKTGHMGEAALHDVYLALCESTNELEKKPDPLAFEMVGNDRNRNRVHHWR